MPPIPTPPDISAVRKGAKSLNYKLPGHNDWEPVVCMFHAGQIQVGGQTDQGEAPIMSPNTGFDPTCDACRKTAQNTLEYMVARWQDVSRSGA